MEVKKNARPGRSAMARTPLVRSASGMTLSPSRHSGDRPYTPAIAVFAGPASGMSCLHSAERTPSAPTTTLAATDPPSENRSQGPSGPSSTATADLP
nr:hypothetical protein GCM10020092_057760 [Actinoplanes digitatis]